VTVRIFDPALDAWRSTWIGPVKAIVKPFIALLPGDEIALDGQFAQGRNERWIFSVITPAAFRWRYVASDDGGVTWTTVHEMAARRVTGER